MTLIRRRPREPRAPINWHKVATIALGLLAGVVAVVGTAAVAAAGFALSFDAIRAVGRAAYIRTDLAWMLPVAIDGAMAVATVTAVMLRRVGRKSFYPWLVVGFGAAISVACNAVHAYMAGGAVILPERVAMAVSAIPAVTLALSIHLLVLLADSVSRRTVVIEAAPVAVRHEPATPGQELAVPDVSPDGNGRAVRTSTLTPRELATALWTKYQDMSPARIGEEVGVHERTVRRWRAEDEVANVNGGAG